MKELRKKKACDSLNSFIKAPDGEGYQEAEGPQDPDIRTDEEIYALGDGSDRVSSNIPEPWSKDLKDHLLYRGLMLGIYSDFELRIANKKSYHLHRFILCQARLFRNFLDDQRSYDPNLVMNWDGLDEYVDIEAVEHILNRLYGNYGCEYYEAKNLLRVMAVCIKFELSEWFFNYLDRYLTRLCADTMFHLIRFSLIEPYHAWIEPHVLPVMKHYMARYGMHLGLEYWRLLPMEWAIHVLTYDGLIFTNRKYDQYKDLGCCRMIMGMEYDRWRFVRDIYYDRVGLDEESLRKFHQDGTLPPNIPEDFVLDRQFELFDFLNSSRIYYGNMTPFQWRAVRNEMLLDIHSLVRGDVLAEGIFEGVRLRHIVEKAAPGTTRLNICFPEGTELPENTITWEVPRCDRFIYRPRRIELEDDPYPDDYEGSLTSEDSRYILQDHLTTFPPLRFSVEFQFYRGIGGLSTEYPLSAEPVFYGGSWWSFRIQRIHRPGEPADRINMYLRRMTSKPIKDPARPASPVSDISDSWATFSDINYEELTRETLRDRFDEQFLDDILAEGEFQPEFYDDPRLVVQAYFRIFAPSIVAGYDPEQFLYIADKEAPKMRAPAISRTTIFEAKPMEFPLDADIVIPGRCLTSVVEEAEELKEFTNDCGYLGKEVERIMEGGAAKLPMKEGRVTNAYVKTGEAGNHNSEQRLGPDRTVVCALKEREKVWMNLKFAVVIGLV
ncbi:hypothetical protein TWF694_003006 [Orbilia ellipsospora]|uniref:BTB domain-containing protein n=1 Tax=Orbilia ellipsospora TaxID=2528407 RepID=A0AAV9X1K9_9PEZI